jgi:carbonic anhydrase
MQLRQDMLPTRRHHQIKQFASLFENNARPTQRRNGRFVIETR